MVIADDGNAYGITKLGAGTLVLSADNTFSGGSTISAGLTQLGHVRGLGTGAVSVASGSAVDVAGFNAANTRLTARRGVADPSGFRRARPILHSVSRGR